MSDAQTTHSVNPIVYYGVNGRPLEYDTDPDGTRWSKLTTLSERWTLTRGNYEAEVDAVADLKTVLDECGSFNVYPEARGQYIQPRFGQDHASARIDMILSPRPALVDQGWNWGCVGVECKRSKEKIGRPISQMIDYSRAIWALPSGHTTMLSYVFLWPFHSAAGPVSSIMGQQRLGGLGVDAGTGPRSLLFHVGDRQLCEISPTGTLSIREAARLVGKKAGSR